MTESLEIQEMLRAAMRDRWGEAALAERFRAFDTICSATQDRQDAVLKMLEEGGLDVMVVIGGYNSSNTQALARICAQRLPTYHISGADRIQGATLHHRPVGAHAETAVPGLAARGPGDGRPDRRRLDPQQRGRRGRGADPGLARAEDRRPGRAADARSPVLQLAREARGASVSWSMFAPESTIPTVLPARVSRSFRRPARPAAPAPSTSVWVVERTRRTASAISASVTVTKPASPSRRAPNVNG